MIAIKAPRPPRRVRVPAAAASPAVQARRPARLARGAPDGIIAVAAAAGPVGGVGGHVLAPACLGGKECSQEWIRGPSKFLSRLGVLSVKTSAEHLWRGMSEEMRR